MKSLKLSFIMVFLFAFSAMAGDFETAISDAVKIVKPSTVYIFPAYPKKSAEADPKNSNKSQPEKQGSGSGVVYDRNGYILTNQHVVDHVKEVNVEFINGYILPGKVLGIDEEADLAVVKVEYPNKAMAELIGEVKMADSSKLIQGQWVFAIGNPFSLRGTITKGIISAMDREGIGLNSLEDFIQTDTPINPGNSGGGLFNLKGELVGINTAIVNYAQAIGFAIPINLAKVIIPELVVNGKFSRGWIGITLQDLNTDLAANFGVDEKFGVVVTEIFSNSPAETAKLQVGDIITAINGVHTPQGSKLKNMVLMIKPGTTVSLSISRLTPDNKRVNLLISMILTERQEDEKVNK